MSTNLTIMHEVTYYADSPAAQALVARYGPYLKDINYKSLMTFRAIASAFRYLWQFEGSAEKGNDAELLSLAFEPYSTFDQDDHEAAQMVWNFCLEDAADSCRYLDPMIHALTDCIYAHPDY